MATVHITDNSEHTVCRATGDKGTPGRTQPTTASANNPATIHPPTSTTVAAAQLDVDMLAFNDVVGVLEDVGFVQGVQRQGHKIVSFTETVPYYDDLYVSLGASWSEGQPTGLEQQLLLVVEELSSAPVPPEELEGSLGLDRSDVPRLLKLGRDAGLVRIIRMIDGDLTYSPFTTAWLIGTLTPGSARRTNTMALCVQGSVGTQLTQTLTGRHRSPLVVATSLGSAAVLFGIVQTPGQRPQGRRLSHFFGCTPLGPIAWTGVSAEQPRPSTPDCYSLLRLNHKQTHRADTRGAHH